MASFCDKCQGAAEPAAQMRTFAYEGQTLRCISLVSSCIICGYRWEDEAYDAENELFAEQARATISSRLQSPHDAHSCDAARNQSAMAAQSR